MQKLVFDNSASDEDLVNFTVLVHLNSSIIDWDDFQVDGGDIRFIDEDYETYLDYEIETWNHGYDAWIWVRVPQIDVDSVIDHVYMYYDNPLAVNEEDKEGTWNNDYVMVQHMVDETNASILDSTQYDNDGTKTGANEPVETINGYVDSAQDFDGVDDYIDCGKDASLEGMTELTMEAWVKGDSRILYQGIIVSWGNPKGYILGYFSPADANKLGHCNFYISNSTANDNIGTTNDLLLDTWYYIVGVFTGGNNLRMYINGVENNSKVTTVTQIGVTLQDTTKIGKYAVYEFNGTIDEVRMSNTTRSGDWIEAQYLSMTENYITYKELSLCETRSNIFPLVLVALFVIIGMVVFSKA